HCHPVYPALHSFPTRRSSDLNVSCVTQLLTEHFASSAASPLAMLLLSCALLWFLMCSTVLFVIDVREHRLPNRWTGLLFIGGARSEEHTSELQSRFDLVCRLL